MNRLLKPEFFLWEAVLCADACEALLLFLLRSSLKSPVFRSGSEWCLCCDCRGGSDCVDLMEEELLFLESVGGVLGGVVTGDLS